jgi:multiple sugar transport system permease protein
LNTKTRFSGIALHVALALFSLILLVPFIWVVSGSFKTQGEFIADPGRWLPESFANFSNYAVLFTEKQFGQYMGNSLIVSGVAVVANVAFGSLAGYALAKIPFRGRRLVFIAVMTALVVPHVALFVPQYMVVVQLRLVDTLAGIVVPLLVLPIGVFITRQYALSIPDELLESARLDGAGELRSFISVFLPLMGPALATVAILTFLASWNQFLWPLIVAQSQGNYTLPVGLAVASQASNTTAFGILLAGAVVVLLPVLFLFLFLQKYFIQGLATTGLK